MNKLMLFLFLIGLSVSLIGTMMECNKYKHKWPLFWTFMLGVFTTLVIIHLEY